MAENTCTKNNIAEIVITVDKSMSEDNGVKRYASQRNTTNVKISNTAHTTFKTPLGFFVSN